MCSENKGLISSAVTAQLICPFVFAYAKSRFSNDAPQMLTVPLNSVTKCSVFYIFDGG